MLSGCVSGSGVCSKAEVLSECVSGGVCRETEMLLGTTFLQNISLVCLGSAAMFMSPHTLTKYDMCLQGQPGSGK